MEESKELQGFYKIFRAVIYISVLMEFFEYAIDPRTIDGFGGVVCDLHDRIKQWFIYHDGNLVYSKVVTFLLVCITCVGTRNKKHLEFDARRQVLYPLVSGVGLLVVSVWLFGCYAMDTRLYALRLNIILYMVATIIGTVLVHVALDNISKFLKEGLMKDRFNFENESFEQCQKEEYNKYSVNIPMRYYYKGKFRKGWVNIVNPFRGTWVVGTPGSGKTFSIIEPFIRQHSAKGFAMVVYDYKFPTLATKLYYHYKKNQQMGKLPEAGHYLGGVGQLILAVTITFACLKTSIGLVTACAETFDKMTGGKFSYRGWAILFTTFSFAVSNVGLSAIINYSIPVLMLIYPPAIALITLAFIGRFFGHDRIVYIAVMIPTWIAALFDFMKTLPGSAQTALHLDAPIAFAAAHLPLFDKNLGWLLPAVIGFAAGMAIRASRRQTPAALS